MMKNPLNRAISPRPPYGRARAGVRHELEHDPEADGPDDEQEREEELRVRVRDPLDPAGAALGSTAPPRRHDHDHQRSRRRSLMPNGMGCWKATRKSCISRAMLADRTPATTIGCGDSLRATRPVRRAPRAGRGHGVGSCCSRRAAARAAGARALSAGGFILRRPRVGTGARRCSRRSSGCRRRRSSSSFSSSDDARRPAPRRSRPRRPPRCADVPSAPHVVRVVPTCSSPRQVSADGHTALRRRPARPAARRLPRRAADPPRAAARRPRSDRRARRRPGVLRRRPGGVRAGPPAQRADLAAARRPRAPRRLRLGGRGRRAARGRRRGGRWSRWPAIFVRRVGPADEHLRAQPRDAARPRARRRLLAAPDQPVPRGAGRGATPTTPDAVERGGPDRRSRPPVGPSSSAA